MSQEFTKRVDGNTVIYDNREARWIFSKGSPPTIDDYTIAINVVDKNINIPIMLWMSGREFRRMLLDMGIKSLNDPRDRYERSISQEAGRENSTEDIVPD